ncbi:putative ATP-dependent RNA helicase TDRD12 [Denticeps clupeoides]|uniref:putative ATP-dependent RNA helicase TDRD12 n=1 Tax=Denticeps clupeoides TaxID=299321 RepID=UPI0010A317CE|nr:putative ATP-dependent RNA helicase TDRD12 [Denticeps clupeoides]XP_028813858.1 putative ATP-dependent RNA helicase TDRD12 [Denticeps clupeoides]XP_028813859.1 putative ATP-dependent RNA helicase TDRD12 [Denticeps clupeoides]
MTGTMLQISILKVEHPGCLWARIMKGGGAPLHSQSEYDQLQVGMNLFYHKVDLDMERLKCPSLQEGQVCVAFSPMLRSWCRAVVDTVFVDTQARCFLVDHGDHLVVSTKDVRAPLDKFLHLPFCVRKFCLAGIHPLKLQVSISQEKAQLVPSTNWDSSATHYLYKLIQASSRAEVLVVKMEGDCAAIDLYLTIHGVKIYVNDDLVLKKFARCSRDVEPVAFSSDFSNPKKFLALNGFALRSRPTDKMKSNSFSAETAQLETEKVSPPNEPSTGKVLVANGGENCDLPDDAEKSVREETESSLAQELFKRLSLIRFMKFLNPEKAVNGMSRCEEQDRKDDEERDLPEMPALEVDIVDLELMSEEISGTSSGCEELEHPKGLQNTELSCIASSDLSEYPNQQQSVKQQKTEDQLACARLMQFINPGPLNLDHSESVNDTNVYHEPYKSGVVVQSAVPIDPCTSLDNGPITEQLRKYLLRKKYSGPGVAECYSWPAVARGCDVVLVSRSGDDPVSYLPPLISHLQLSTIFSAHMSHKGPVAVILCPGWEKAQRVMYLLEETRATQNLNPALVLLGMDQDEARATKIHNNCQVLVTTPFSLVRMLACHCFLFLGICHLVLDEVDLLFSRATEEMATVLQHFKKVLSREERTSCPQQIIAVGMHWSAQVGALIRDHMSDPSIIITVKEEAALCGGVHQVVLLCLDCTKMSVMLGALDLTPSVPQKTLIVTNSVEEVEDVYKSLTMTSAFSLKAHEGLTYKFDFVIKQWRRDIGPGTHVILVITNDCIKALGIMDASCVVHYGFPASPKIFGERLFCMSDNFSKAYAVSHCHAKSILLLSEQNVRHFSGVQRYLKRTDALLPPDLLQFAQGFQQAKEEQKTDRDLCSYIKTLGFCRDSSVCPDRHVISKTQDQPQHPESGSVQVLPLCIKSATHYYGRIISKNDDCYKKFAAEMAEYYASEKPWAKDVSEGLIYAVQEEDVYHRVQIVSVPDKGHQLFHSVVAHFLDEGRTQSVKSHQLLQLPAHLQKLRPQAVEMILCRVRPIDSEVDWNSKVTRVISEKIRGKLHYAKVVLCLGNTIWVDPLVHMTWIPGLKTYINEYSVHTEILDTGMGIANPQHLDLLKELSRGSAAMEESSAPDSTKADSEPKDLAADTTPASRNLTNGESHLPSQGLPASRLTLDPECEGVLSLTAALTQLRDTGNLQGNLGHYSAPENKTWITTGTTDQICSKEDISVDKVRSFHPQIKWHQNQDKVFLHIKLINPLMQKCEFFSDRVIYSAHMINKKYCVDLELMWDVIADKCSWEMKCNEPVIELVKKEHREWSTLLKYKNACVGYDFDYIEEGKVKVLNGDRFEEDAGEEGCYVNLDSGSESD